MTPLQAAVLPMNAGWTWISEGIGLFRRQPIAMIFWSIATSFVINMGALIPILGQIALVILTPLLTFLTLCGCRNLARNIRMPASKWLEPLQKPGTTRPLLRLGLLYLLVTFVAAFAAVTPFLSDITALTNAPSDSLDFSQLLDVMMGPFIVFGLFYVVISAVFWHTPALVGWHNLPLKRALFYSMVACWRNKFPMIIYIGTWGALFYILHTAVASLTDPTSPSMAAAWIMLPVDIIVTAVLYSSFYPIYASIFEATQADLN